MTDQISPLTGTFGPQTSDTKQPQEMTLLCKELGIVYPQVLAEALGMSMHTLQLWRQNGSGPKFVKLGKNVFYRVSDIKEWLENNITDRVHERVANADTPSMYRETGEG